MTSRYSELHLDALQQVARIGSSTAATALATMLRRPVDVSMPDARALPLADAVDATGPAETEVVAVAIEIVGGVEGTVLLLLGAGDADRLCELLGIEPDSELAASALAEVGNILGSAYIGALATMIGIALDPHPPQTMTDMLGAIVGSLLATAAEATDLALLLESELRVASADVSFSFILVPDASSTAELLRRLGLDE